MKFFVQSDADKRYLVEEIRKEDSIIHIEISRYLFQAHDFETLVQADSVAKELGYPWKAVVMDT